MQDAQQQVQQQVELPTLCDYGLLVLNTHDTREKAKLTQAACKKWFAGALPVLGTTFQMPPTIPARPLNVATVAPKDVPKRGAGNVQNRIALIHSIAHMESYAIDLAWDIVCRFANLSYLPKVLF